MNIGIFALSAPVINNAYIDLLASLARWQTDTARDHPCTWKGPAFSQRTSIQPQYSAKYTELQAATCALIPSDAIMVALCQGLISFSENAGISPPPWTVLIKTDDQCLHAYRAVTKCPLSSLTFFSIICYCPCLLSNAFHSRSWFIRA